MNRKAKGSRNERKSARLLQAAGYKVTKSGASLGCFDLIGISATDIVLVQCKSNAWPSNLEMEAIKEFKAPSNSRKLIHRWNDRESLPIIKEI
jgi:Holliday junction resolvase